jgi:hypothetical protein
MSIIREHTQATLSDAWRTINIDALDPDSSVNFDTATLHPPQPEVSEADVRQLTTQVRQLLRGGDAEGALRGCLEAPVYNGSEQAREAALQTVIEVLQSIKASDMTPMLRSVYGSPGGSECLDVLMKYLWVWLFFSWCRIECDEGIHWLTGRLWQIQGHGGHVVRVRRQRAPDADPHDAAADGLQPDRPAAGRLERVDGRCHERAAQLAREGGRGRGAGVHRPGYDRLAESLRLLLRRWGKMLLGGAGKGKARRRLRIDMVAFCCEV